MVHSTLRDILKETQLEMEALFAGGMACGDRRESSLLEAGRRMEEAGLRTGAAMASELRAALSSLRVDGGWTAENASEAFARLWDYLNLCMDRLDYLEAKDGFSKKPSYPVQDRPQNPAIYLEKQGLYTL